MYIKDDVIVSTLHHPNAPLLNSCTAQIFFFYNFALIFFTISVSPFIDSFFLFGTGGNTGRIAEGGYYG
jgi:hypothetical protein